MKQLLVFPAALIRIGLPLWKKLRQAWAYTMLSAKLRHEIADSVVVLGSPEVHGSANIHLGESLYLYPGLYLETQEQGMIRIGDSVVLSRGVHLVSFAEITIGAGTMIGEYTSIRDANHQYGTSPSLREAGHRAAPISIGCNVWIGRGVTILPGITIHDNAVVGANAVVTHDVMPHCVVAGVPARPIQSRRAA